MLCAGPLSAAAHGRCQMPCFACQKRVSSKNVQRCRLAGMTCTRTVLPELAPVAWQRERQELRQTGVGGDAPEASSRGGRVGGDASARRQRAAGQQRAPPRHRRIPGLPRIACRHPGQSRQCWRCARSTAPSCCGSALVFQGTWSACMSLQLGHQGIIAWMTPCNSVQITLLHHPCL